MIRRTVLALLLAAAASLSSLVPVAAREFTDAEKAGLADAVKAFDTAMRGNDFAQIVAVIPPKVLQAMADKFKLPVDQLKTMVVQQTQAAMETVKFESFGMDLDKTSYLETADGTPYALIPTVVVMEIGNGKMKADGATLGIIDDGAWYLVRISEKKQVETFKSVYPAFADVEFPKGSLETVK